MIEFLKRLYNLILGKAETALDKVDDKTTVAKQNLAKMKKSYEEMQVAVANLNAEVLLSEKDVVSLKKEIDGMDVEIDKETNKYLALTDENDKAKLKKVIDAYIQNHGELAQQYEVKNNSYLAQKAKLDNYKEKLAQLTKEIKDAEFTTKEIQINDSINKANGAINRKDSFIGANNVIKELGKQVETETLANDAMENLGKSEAELIIEAHKKEQKEINISDEFQKRIAKAQAK